MKVSACGGDSFLTESDLVLTYEKQDPNNKSYKCYFLCGERPQYAFCVNFWYRKQYGEEGKYMMFDGWSWVHVFDILNNIEEKDLFGNKVKIVHTSKEMKQYFSGLSSVSRQANTTFLLNDILSAS
jgi:hypothetical protein